MSLLSSNAASKSSAFGRYVSPAAWSDRVSSSASSSNRETALRTFPDTSYYLHACSGPFKSDSRGAKVMMLYMYILILVAFIKVHAV